jgi:hypothetical protein
LRATVLHPPTAGSPAATRRGLRRLTLPRLWLLVVLGGIAAMQLAATPNAVDLAYHVRAGALMVHDHAILRTDPFAWPTAGRPWLDQNWGAQVIFYGLWRLGGFSLIGVANALATVGALALVAAACRRRTANLRVIAGALMVGFTASVFIFTARPQTFSVVLFAAELYLLELARTRPRALLALPPLMALWANLHGAFVLGLGLLAAEVVVAGWPRRAAAAEGEPRWRVGDPRALRRLAPTLPLCVLALLANPWGVGVLRYAVGFATNRSITAGVTEWAPANLRDGAGATLLVAIAVVVVALTRAGAPPRARDQLLRAVPLLLLSLWTIRASVWFGLEAPLLLAALAREERPRPAGDEQGTRLGTGMVLAAVVLALLLAAPPTRHLLVAPTRSRPDLGMAPAATADWLAAHPEQGRMLNYQPWGSYLEFRLGPAVQVGFDSRIELPAAVLWDDYAAVASGRFDTERILERLQIAYVVTDAKQTPQLVATLVASDRWRLAFADHDERVFVQRTASPAP